MVPEKRGRVDLILASGSPRRHRLLEEAGIAHEVFPVVVDETLPADADPVRAAVTLAERKARRAGELRPDATILAADTLVELDSRLMGKPANAGAAREMLRALSGRTHRVVTGVCLHEPREGRTIGRVVVTTVRFRELEPEEIRAYVDSGESLDKAGAYGIQGAAGAFVERMEGPFDNVVGLPVAAVREMLAEW